jgi:DMSO/TMAO reductase YedYZ molybdopterin-dependent catalytic subunit
MQRTRVPPTRAELEALIRAAEAEGITRRQLLKLFLAGGFGGVLSACEPPPRNEAADSEEPAPVPWVKDPAAFIQHPTNLETRLELLDGVITPNELFFVRNHAPTPVIDATTWRLRLDGDGLRRPLELSLDDLRTLPAESLVAYVECAGNWRSFWEPLVGRTASGGQWGTGGISCAELQGPTLASVLERAGGVAADAVDVDLVGLDDGAFSRPMPIARALDPTTLLALSMNGEPLPPDNGFPVRAIVPGWVGSSSVKWLGRVRVSTPEIWSKNNTTSYVLIGPEWPPEQYAPADGAPITTGVVKSALALPRPARLSPGIHRIRGFAYSPHGPIGSIEWSDDGGATWRAASILEPVHPLAWQRFEFEWNAPAGTRTLLTRATDVAGDAQPNAQPFNEKGYLLNIVLPHRVEVG